MKTRGCVELESFEVTSGKLMVSDPCYDKGTWCQGVLENVKNGKWVAQIVNSDEGHWSSRVAELRIFHLGDEDVKTSEERRASFEVGVDSGQAGFYDESKYPQDPGSWDGSGGFYDRICSNRYDHDEGEKDVIVLEGGVTSSSGYGDGIYNCYYMCNLDGEIVRARIVFISDEES